MEKSYRFDEAATEPVLRRVLAWQNIAGATRSELGRSVRLIEGAGSADGFVGRLAAERRPLEAMGRLERLALEIAVNERAERDRLAGQAAALEAGWARAAELADIIDEELSGV